MICRFFALPEAPVTNPMGSPSPWGLSIGAALGASHHLMAMQKASAKAGSKATAKAFKARQDAPFAASPCPLGRVKALSAGASLLPGFSPAPWRALRLGTPVGGASRAVPARPARSAGSALDGPPQTSSLPVGSESVCPRFCAAPMGVPKRREARAWGAGLCPPRHDRRLGASYPAGAGYRLWRPPILPRGRGRSYGLDALRPASPVPKSTRLVGRAKRKSGVRGGFRFLEEEVCIMKKLKKSVCVFLGAIGAEIRRFNDFIDREDEKWRLDPVAAEKRFDEAFSRFAIWAGAVLMLGIVLDIFV